jgi:phage/plasmid-associated DNA primase
MGKAQRIIINAAGRFAVQPDSRTAYFIFLEKNMTFTESKLHLPLSMQIATNMVKLYNILLIRDIETGVLFPVFFRTNRYIDDRQWDQIRGFIKAEIVNLFSYWLNIETPGKDTTASVRFDNYNLTDADFRNYSNNIGYVNALVNNVVKDILDFNAIVREESGFDGNAYEINCLNGVFNIQTGVLQPHRPDKFVRHIVNAKYNEACTANDLMKMPSLFIKMLSDALYDRTLNDVDNKQIVHSFMAIVASCLIGNNLDKYVYVIVGIPNSGKSTLLNVLLKIFGSYCSAISNTALMVSPRTKNDIRPDIISCRNSRIWMGSESNKKDKFDNALLKQLAGNDTVSFRKPHKGTMIDFVVKGKLILVTNYFPTFSDLDDVAFLNRIVLIDFNNTPDVMDKTLEGKLLQPESMNEIFTHLADIAHQQWLTGKDFIHERFKTNKQRIIINQNSSVALFWNEHIRPHEKYDRFTFSQYKNPVKLLYSVMYRNFCERIKVKSLDLEPFAKEFKLLSDMYPLVSWQKGTSNNFYYGFTVIGKKSDEYYNFLNRGITEKFMTGMEGSLTN